MVFLCSCVVFLLFFFGFVLCDVRFWVFFGWGWIVCFFFSVVGLGVCLACGGLRVGLVGLFLFFSGVVFCFFSLWGLFGAVCIVVGCCDLLCDVCVVCFVDGGFVEGIWCVFLWCVCFILVWWLGVCFVGGLFFLFGGGFIVLGVCLVFVF